MKLGTKFVCIILLVLILVIPAADYVGYIRKHEMMQTYDLFELFNHKVLGRNSEVAIIDVIPFNWDYVYVLEPYSTAEDFKSLTGIEYYRTTTYTMYKLAHNLNLHSDDVKKIIFIYNNQIVYDFNYSIGSIDFIVGDSAQANVTILKKNGSVYTFE